MRAVVQRVSRASVTVNGEVVGSINRGLMVLVGVTHGDGDADARAIGAKIAGLRIFRDNEGKMNLSLSDIGAAVLLVSQFTLYGSVSKGRRPSFVDAASSAVAEPLVDAVATALGEHGLLVETGVFGADMSVDLTNDGPVTLVLESQDGRIL
jgi:D-tyrosyl-tRNA(Tyr) deacylase